MASKVVQTALGIGLAVASDRVWQSAGSNPTVQAINAWPLDHTHVGLAAFILANHFPAAEWFLSAFGAGLIVTDAFQRDWFGLANPPNPASDVEFAVALYGLELGILLGQFSVRGTRPGGR